MRPTLSSDELRRVYVESGAIQPWVATPLGAWVDEMKCLPLDEAGRAEAAAACARFHAGERWYLRGPR